MTTTAQLTLPPKPASVSAARRFVVNALLDLDIEGPCDDAATLVSELATNAVLHARTPFTVEVSLDEGSVRISVLDHSPSVPRLRDYGTGATTGRGIRLVDTMSTRWGVQQDDDGKHVWFELPAQGVQDVHTWDEETDAEVLMASFAEPNLDEAPEPDAPRVLGWAA